MSDGAAHPDVVIDVVDLEKRYRSAEAPALRGISLRVHRGEVLGLLGPNGAGKTTTVEILAGLRERTSGHVRVLGLDPGRRDHLVELRTKVGLVLQHTGHYRYLSVRETIDMHRSWHAQPRDADEVLAMVDLESCSTQRVRELSGGQQRRLDVGVALVGRPELIFLDEPTTGFDPAARRRAWEVIEELADGGTSIVLTTHYMEEAARLADDVIVLAHGRIAASGTPDAISRRARPGTVIRATLPFGITPADLPDDIAAGLIEPGCFELRVDGAENALGSLCAWAVGRGMQLEDLDVRAPNLEDSYLALTGEADDGNSIEAADQ